VSLDRAGSGSRCRVPGRPDTVVPAGRRAAAGGDPIAVEHTTSTVEIGEGRVQATCSCGWRSEVFGTDKTTGTMDPLQQAMDARDLHEWEVSLR
jgi:hypothetical protein